MGFLVVKGRQELECSTNAHKYPYDFGQMFSFAVSCSRAWIHCLNTLEQVNVRNSYIKQEIPWELSGMQAQQFDNGSKIIHIKELKNLSCELLINFKNIRPIKPIIVFAAYHVCSSYKLYSERWDLNHQNGIRILQMNTRFKHCCADLKFSSNIVLNSSLRLYSHVILPDHVCYISKEGEKNVRFHGVFHASKSARFWFYTL